MVECALTFQYSKSKFKQIHALKKRKEKHLADMFYLSLHLNIALLISNSKAVHNNI